MSIQQVCARWFEEECRQIAVASQYDCTPDWNSVDGLRAMRDSYGYWAAHPAGLTDAGLARSQLGGSRRGLVSGRRRATSNRPRCFLRTVPGDPTTLAGPQRVRPRVMIRANAVLDSCRLPRGRRLFLVGRVSVAADNVLELSAVRYFLPA